jgi:hypothetical protein
MKTSDLRIFARVTVLAVMAAGLASMTPAQASVLKNSLTANALTQNALTMNALTQNALTQNALTQNALSINALTFNALTTNSLALSAVKGGAPASDVVGNLNGVAVESVILPTTQAH